MTEHTVSPYGFRVKLPTRGCEVKDVDAKQGVVVGYFSSFYEIDAHNQYTVPGAFRKTIAEWGPAGRGRIAHLIDHNMTRRIGRLIKLEEDGFGLRFESQLSRNSYGRDALIEYEEGILREHSFGYDVIGWKRDEEQDAVVLTEVRMYEGSAVTWGANMNTPVVDVKGLIEDPLLIDHLIDQMKAIKRVLRREITDERAEQLESSLTSHEQIVSELRKALVGPHTRTEPSGLVKSTCEPLSKEYAMIELVRALKSNT